MIEIKDRQLNMRVSERELKEWKDIAKANRMSVAEMIRTAIRIATSD